uniref:Eukaryotic translation initiation factor 3 subunit C n=1 Tax=Scophthalmus maximus TaxID=52904 RepID=A0A8D3BQI6_SCOMX
MSRFFATGSDSESEESSSADEITPKAPGTNFKQSLLLSDDEEDTKRVVRSAKDKRFEELTNLIKTIRNAMKIRDMAKCLEEFEQLCRAFLKSKNIVDKEGVPSFYIRLLADLEDYLNQLWEDKEGKKKMNKNNAKALSTLRQKIRKYNRDYETEVAAYKEVKDNHIIWIVKNVSIFMLFICSIHQEKPKMFAKGTEINTVVVLKKLNEILQARGKKGTDRAAQIELLHALANISAENNLGIGILVKIKFNIIASLYDYNPNLAAFMKSEWEKMILILDESLSISDQPFRVRGCVLTLVERMDEEFTKIMQNTDPHSQEYVDNLKDEGHVCGIIDRLLDYLENKGSTEEICRIYLRRIMHTYYKFDYKAHRRSLGLQGESKSEQDQEESEGEDSAVIMDRLCKFIYAKDRTDRIRTCAILCHIYHHALHSRWYQARDLMLMSHLQDNIQHADPPVQILYNRTMVQLGICAFRQGMIKDAHNALLDIQSSGRAKELLGQGLLMRNMQERNAEQEKIEKRRQVPFHMHINLELLECVYLVSAMLLEIPYMAAHEFDARRRMISKQFHHQLRVGERQPLLGPPESMREHVVAASKAMKMGDWRTCHSFIINEKMNSKVWDLFPETQRVREMLVRKIQEESLRTYLFTYSSVYDSISMATLSEMFELEIPMVHSIISKMIINEELMASLDQPTQTVVMHRTEPTSLQNMALQLAEKLGSLVENNERVFDLKQGVYGGYFNRDQKGGYQNKQGYNRGGYNRNHNQSNY